MSKIVIKYGGSNLRSSHGIEQLAGILRSLKDPAIVVVSALSGVTDYIEETLRNMGDLNLLNTRITALKMMHLEFMRACKGPGDDITIADQKFQDRFSELEHLFLGAYYLRALPIGLYDQILSYGERLSSLLISELISNEGIECREALPEDIGLITTGEYNNASVDFDQAEPLVQKALNEKITFVIPGFYGVSQQNQVNLFGRGGTDYSAAAIASCIHAGALYIWKDVSGFMSADPRFIKGARNLATLTYNEAAELAYFGAKILHPRTVEPLMKKNIPVYLFSTGEDTGILKPVTVINGQKEVSDKVIKSITFSDQFAILNLSGPGVGIKPGILAKIANALNEQKINISSVITSHISINILLDARDIVKAEEISRRLEMPFVSDIRTLQNISLVALVGHGMTEKYGVASRVFMVLANYGINVYLSSMGASDVTTYLIVDREKRSIALEAIHNEFFN